MNSRYIILLAAFIVTGMAAYGQWSDIMWMKGGHMLGVSAIAATVDGEQVLSGSHDFTVKLWEWRPGKLLRTFVGARGGITSVAISSDETLVAAASDDSTARVWNAATGEEMHVFTDHQERVTSVAFVPNSSFLVTGGFDGRVRFWNAATGESLGSFMAQPSGVSSLAIDRKGTLIATGGVGEDSLRIWRANGGAYVRTVHNPGSPPNNLVRFSPGGKYLYSTGSSADSVRIWNTSDWGTEATIPIHYGMDGRRWAITHDETTLVTYDSDSLRLWNIEDGTLRSSMGSNAELPGVPLFATIETLPNGTVLVGESRTGVPAIFPRYPVLQVRSLEAHAVISDCITHTSVIQECAFTDNGTRIATASGGYAARFDTSGITLYRWSPGGDELTSSVASDGEYVAQTYGYSEAGIDEVLLVHKIGSDGFPPSVAGNLEMVFDVAVSRNGAFAAVAAQNRALMLYDVPTRTGKSLDGNYNTPIFSDDLRFLAALNPERNVVSIWSLPGGEMMGGIVAGTTISAIAFSYDGSLIAIGDIHGAIRMYDVGTRVMVKSVPGHSGIISSLAFSRNGGYLVSGGQDSTIKSWNLQTRTLIHTYDTRPVIATSLAVSPNGKRIASGSNDGTLALWRARGEMASVKHEEIATGIYLHEPSPNPASGAVTIHFRLDKPMPATLKIFTITGDELAVLAQGTFEQGEHSLSWNTKNIPAGNYLLRLEAGETVHTRRVVVVK